MLFYILRRLPLALLTLWLVSVAAFVLLRVAPGDAAVASLALLPGEGALSPEELDRRRHDLGLDKPYVRQYLDWAGKLARLDAGRSTASGRSLLPEIWPRLWVTVELAAVTLVFVSALGVGAGLLGASARGRWADALARGIALAGLSLPAFWTGLLLIVAVAAWTGTFIAATYVPFWEGAWANLRAVLPAALVLAVRPASLVARVVRAATKEALEQDFVRAARARGLGEPAVLWRYAFRAAALPVVTVIGVEAIFLLGGAVVIEQVFSLPGLGRALVAGVVERDYPVVQFLVLLFGGMAVALNLAADVLYARLDPRVRRT